MARIPDGWHMLTSDLDEDEAWRLGVEYKQGRERVHGSLFVRIRVVRAYVGSERTRQKYAYWVLTKEEERQP